MKIAIEVIGEPKGQPRPRAVAGNFGVRMYDAGTAEGWKSCITAEAKPKLPTEPISGPVAMTAVFRMPRPKGHFRTGKNANELKPSAPSHHTSKPDVDNLLKAVMDCLSRLRLWRDDDQVCKLREVEKRYVRPGERPGMYLVIETIEGAAVFAAK